MIVKIRFLRLCLTDWRQWTKLRLRSALSVNRSLGTESCRAILFWAMKFCPPPPIHFNWWTLYPKFRVYGTAAILSRTAKFIVFLRFARWRRAVVLARSCCAQAAVLHQARSSAFVCTHFTMWFLAHYAQRKGCTAIRSFYWRIFRSRVRAQNRLRALLSLVNARLLSSAIDFFALAVFTKDNVVFAKIPCYVASRVAKSFMLDTDRVQCALLQKFILRRFLQGILRSWLLLMLASKRRRLLDSQTYFSSWCFFVNSAQRYREEAGRRHEQLQRLCSISQRVDKRLKCITLRHLHSLCRDRRNVFAAVACVSSRLRVHRCIKTVHAVLRHNLVISQAASKLRFKAVYGILRPVLCAWNQLVLVKAHRKLWDTRDAYKAFQNWSINAADIKQRRIALEVLQRRVLLSKNRFCFSFWHDVVKISHQKRSTSDKFFKSHLAAGLRKLLIAWRFLVFRSRRETILLSSCWFTWRGVVRDQKMQALALKSLRIQNLNRTLSIVIAAWSEWLLLRSRRRLMRRKIESKRSTFVSGRVFSYWLALTRQSASQMKQKCQNAFLFRAEVLLRAFYVRWRHVQVHKLQCVQKSLSSITRHTVSRFFALWAVRATAGIVGRLKKIACTALASRNSVISSFRLWRLFAFSHSSVQRHLATPNVASTLAQSGRVLLSSMTVSQRSRVMLLPRVLQVAFVWFNQRGGRSLRHSLLSCSDDSYNNAVGGSSNSSSSDERTPLSMSQLFASQASVGPAARHLGPSLEWHRPNFGAQTSLAIADESSRMIPMLGSEAPQVRAAQLQQMLDELYGKSMSP